MLVLLPRLVVPRALACQVPVSCCCCCWGSACTGRASSAFRARSVDAAPLLMALQRVSRRELAVGGTTAELVRGPCASEQHSSRRRLAKARAPRRRLLAPPSLVTLLVVMQRGMSLVVRCC